MVDGGYVVTRDFVDAVAAQAHIWERDFSYSQLNPLDYLPNYSEFEFELEKFKPNDIRKTFMQDCLFVFLNHVQWKSLSEPLIKAGARTVHIEVEPGTETKLQRQLRNQTNVLIVEPTDEKDIPLAERLARKHGGRKPVSQREFIIAIFHADISLLITPAEPIVDPETVEVPLPATEEPVSTLTQQAASPKPSSLPTSASSPSKRRTSINDKNFMDIFTMPTRKKRLPPPSSAHARKPTASSSSKSKPITISDDEDDAVFVAPTAAAMRKKAQTQKTPEPDPTPEPDTSSLAIVTKKRTKPQDPVFIAAKANKDQQVQQDALNEASQAANETTLDTNLGVIETFHIRRDTVRGGLQVNSIPMAEDHSRDPRWEAEWKHRNNFKKFRKAPHKSVAKRYFVKMGPSQTQDYGIGERMIPLLLLGTLH